MLRSMTGFGTARTEAAGWVYAFEARSVNHRYCDVRVHVPSDLSGLVGRFEATARKKIRRGRVDIGLAVSHADDATVVPCVDLARARGYKKAYELVAEDLSLPKSISLEAIAGAPGVIRSPEIASDLDDTWTVLEPVLVEALADLEKMRVKEGTALESELSKHLGVVRTIVDGIKTGIPEALAERKARLSERVQDLLGDVALDPMRMAQELAILADRADVTEELERLESHCAQFEKLVSETQPVGRKLDFLLQEMNREGNTIGSKSSSSGIAYLVMDLKAELERMREQVQNVE